MFCKNCGKPVNEDQAICLNCGVLKESGNDFCQYCGKPVAKDATICLNCGCEVASENTTVQNESIVVSPSENNTKKSTSSDVMDWLPFALAISSIAALFIFGYLISIPLAIISLILSIVAKRKGKSKGLTVAALIISISSTVINIVSLLISIVLTILSIIFIIIEGIAAFITAIVGLVTAIATIFSSVAEITSFLENIAELFS